MGNYIYHVQLSVTAINTFFYFTEPLKKRQRRIPFVLDAKRKKPTDVDLAGSPRPKRNNNPREYWPDGEVDSYQCVFPDI